MHSGQLQPCLQKYQECNQPAFIQNKFKEALETHRTDEPEAKRMKRQGAVEPLERTHLISPLPELPLELQQKQVCN